MKGAGHAHPLRRPANAPNSAPCTLLQAIQELQALTIDYNFLQRAYEQQLSITDGYRQSLRQRESARVFYEDEHLERIRNELTREQAETRRLQQELMDAGLKILAFKDELAALKKQHDADMAFRMEQLRAGAWA